MDAKVDLSFSAPGTTSPPSDTVQTAAIAAHLRGYDATVVGRFAYRCGCVGERGPNLDQARWCRHGASNKHQELGSSTGSPCYNCVDCHRSFNTLTDNTSPAAPQARAIKSLSLISVSEAYDNAMCQSFLLMLQSKLLSRREFVPRAETIIAYFSSIEGFPDPARLHCAVGYQPSVCHEQRPAQEIAAVPSQPKRLHPQRRRGTPRTPATGRRYGIGTFSTET
jgi:putative transposase